MKRVLGRLTYANVAATLALFIALAGGTAYAASQVLPKNSVGPKQLKKDAVTPAKLSPATKKALTGPKGATGAQGIQGPKGDPGPAGPFAETLPSGKTLKGQWSVISYDEDGQASFSYGIPLAAPPNPGKVHFILEGAAVPPGCSGTAENPGATPGNLCVFVSYGENFRSEGSCVVDPTAEYNCNHGVGTKFSTTGATVYVVAETTGERLDAAGSWAVTAP